MSSLATYNGMVPTTANDDEEVPDCVMVRRGWEGGLYHVTLFLTHVYVCK